MKRCFIDVGISFLEMLLRLPEGMKILGVDARSDMRWPPQTIRIAVEGNPLPDDCVTSEASLLQVKTPMITEHPTELVPKITWEWKP